MDSKSPGIFERTGEGEVTAPRNASLASVRLGGRDYPQVAVQTCRVCSHPARARCESLLVEGRSPATIATIIKDGPPLTSRNLTEHLRNGHLPVQHEAVTRLRDQHAEERGQALEDGVARLVTSLSFATRVMDAVDTRLARGQVEVTVADGIKAAALVERMAKQTEPDRADGPDLYLAFAHYLSAIRHNTDDAQYKAVCHEIKTDPILQALWKRREQGRQGTLAPAPGGGS